MSTTRIKISCHELFLDSSCFSCLKSHLLRYTAFNAGWKSIFTISLFLFLQLPFLDRMYRAWLEFWAEWILFLFFPLDYCTFYLLLVFFPSLISLVIKKNKKSKKRRKRPLPRSSAEKPLKGGKDQLKLSKWPFSTGHDEWISLWCLSGLVYEWYHQKGNLPF